MSGWHNRGYLPHVDFPHLWQFVTFRLVDALPRPVIERWKRQVADHPLEDRQRILRKNIDAYEDAGHGSCLLRNDRCAACVVEQIAKGDRIDYRLAAWVIMPNHVHVLVGPMGENRIDLSQLTRQWKGASARAINLAMSRTGTVWQAESFDRWIRDDEHFRYVVAYIAENPVRAGFCERAEQWQWSHAWMGDKR